jgi:hypothetical protein
VDIKIVFMLSYGLLNFLLMTMLPTDEDLEIKEPQPGFAHTSQAKEIRRMPQLRLLHIGDMSDLSFWT